MKVSVSTDTLHLASWHEYGLRFLFGGAITVIAGLIAKKFGASVGGLFLAFPAILPAGATLVEKHEKQKKNEVGLAGTQRGRVAAGVDAAGSAMGSVGLLVFAVVVWRLLPGTSTWLVFAGATLAWLFTAVAVWYLRKMI